jgi:hypothetical protein
MALAAQTVALVKLDEFPIVEPQLVPVLCVVTVETPPHGFCMVEFDVVVGLFEFPLFPVDFHGGVALTAGEYPLRERGRADRELLFFFGEQGQREYEKGKK